MLQVSNWELCVLVSQTKSRQLNIDLDFLCFLSYGELQTGSCYVKDKHMKRLQLNGSVISYCAEGQK